MISKVTDTRIDKPTSAPLDAANKNADTTTQPQSPITGRLGTKEVTQLVSSTTDQPQQLSSTEKAEATDAPNSPKNLETRTVSVVDPKADNSSDALKADSNAAIPNADSNSKAPGTHAPQVTSEKLVAPAASTSDFGTEVDPKTAQKELLALYADRKYRETYDRFIKEYTFSSLEELLGRCIKDGFDINHKNKSGQTFLHVAAVWKDLELVKALLLRKADPNSKTAFKNTPLIAISYPESDIVSTSKNLEIMKVLLNAGADVHAQNYTHYTPLLVATQCGDIDAIKLFLDASADIEAIEKNYGFRALHIAAEQGYLDAVQLLLERGAQIDAASTVSKSTPLFLAAIRGHVTIVKLLIEKNANINAVEDKGFSVLHGAIIKRQESVVDILLAAGANINLEDNAGVTALGMAAYKGFTTIVERLLNAGVLIEASKSKSKRKALHHAAFQGHLQIVKILIELNAKVDPIDNHNCTPLNEAVFNGHIGVAAFLLENGANINAVDIHGKSILCTAIEHKHEELVKLLVQKGADVNSVDNQGDTPLVHALSQGHAEISAFLIHNGAVLYPVNP